MKRVEAKKTNNKVVFVALLIIIAIIICIIVVLVQKNKKEEADSGEGTKGENTVSYVEEVEDGVKINKSTKLNEAKEINGIQISNIQLTTKDGMTTLLADVKNNSESKTKDRTIQITLINEDGSELTTITGILKGLEVGEETQLNIATTSDYVNAYDFKVALK